MQGKSVMDAMMGDYRPEVQPGPNAGMQQRMMSQQPQDHQKLVELSARFAKLQDAQSLAQLIAAVGGGMGVAGAMSGAVPIAAAGAGLGALGLAANEGGKIRGTELIGEQSAAYPGIYGSK